MGHENHQHHALIEDNTIENPATLGVRPRCVLMMGNYLLSSRGSACLRVYRTYICDFGFGYCRYH